MEERTGQKGKHSRDRAEGTQDIVYREDGTRQREQYSVQRAKVRINRAQGIEQRGTLFPFPASFA
jgi:hypothetical protein